MRAISVVSRAAVSPPGARPALRQLFDEHARYIWRSLRHLGVADPDVDDLCQEVFLTAHRKLPDFEGRSSPRTWLYGICLRVASDYRRSAYVRRERAVAEPLEAAPALSGKVQAAEAETAHVLRRLLSHLDADKLEVLVLYEIEGFAMKEVAEIVGCPLQTAYSRLYAAREFLMALAKDRESGVG